MKVNIKKKIRIYFIDMKKNNIIKFIIIFLLFIFTSKQAYCAQFDFSKGFIDDNANFLTDRYKNPLNEVLQNLHKETGCDLVLLTLNSLSNNETYENIEKQVHSRYLFGGKNKDKWAMIIITRVPYRMNIRVGKGLRKIIFPRTRRAMGFEFFIHSSTDGYEDNNNLNHTRQVSQYSAQNFIYSTTLFLAELIADSQNKRLHTTRRTETENLTYNVGNRTYTEPLYTRIIPEVYIRQTEPFIKFVRRNNLYPTLILIFIGLLPFMYQVRRRRR